MSSSDQADYRHVFETVADGLLLLEDTIAGVRIAWLNAAAARVLGLGADARDVLVRGALLPELAAALESDARACLATQSTVARQFEIPHELHPSTHRMTLSPVSAGERTALRVAGVIHDVTQQRELEAALHARAEEFRALVENAPDLITRYDTEGRMLYNNPAIERLGQRRAADMRSLTPQQVSPRSTTAARFHQSVLEVARTGLPDEVELLIDTFSPIDIGWYHLRLVPERDENGNVVSVLGIARDITELKRTEAKMRGLAEHLSLATEVAQLGIMTVDLERGEIRLDERMRGIFGLDSTTITRPMLRAVILPEDLERADAHWARVFETKAPTSVDYRIRRADGQVRWLEGRAAPQLTEDRVTSVLAALWDVTERKQAEQQRFQLEAQLRQAQKLEAVGTLAGGIAHDFNNILGAILGNVALLTQDLGDGHPALASAEEIDKAAQRGKDLVQRLLAFGRPQDQQQRPVSLQAVVEEVVKLLRPTLPRSAEIIVEPAHDVPPVLIDSGQISQVLMNLCVNAYQALIDHKGRIEIGIEVSEVDERLPPLPAGRCVVLSVRDNGCGMSPEVMEHIFEPFYTTKPFGEGSGLGLAIVHGIIRAHGGTVRVNGAVGRGTTFSIYLPALPDDTPCESFDPAAHNATPTKGNGQRILYIDDEEPLVFLAKRLFERAGYRPECFTDPDAAVQAFRCEPDRYDLVITDLSMPGTSGMEVARSVLAMNPNAKVVLASGYVRPSDVEAAQAIGIRDVVLKPNTVEELTAVIRRLLEH